MVIVAELTESSAHCYSKNYTRLSIIKREDFLKTWSGVYLIAEPSEHSGEKRYEQNRRKALINSLIPASLFMLLLALSLLFVSTTINESLGGIAFNTTGVYLQYFLLLAGLL